MHDDSRRGRRGSLQNSPDSAPLGACHRGRRPAGRRRRTPASCPRPGGGTGGIAVPLAALGHHVTVVDPSPDALASLERRVRDEGLADADRNLVAVQGDSTSLRSLDFGDGADLVTCHGVLEVDDDPVRTLTDIAGVLRPGGTLSLLVAQRLAVVFTRALAGRFTQARNALGSADGRYGEGDPMPRRFDQADLCSLVAGAGLQVVDVHGLRILTDLVPSAFVDSDADREALLALERAMAEHPEHEILGRLGSVLHVLARR